MNKTKKKKRKNSKKDRSYKTLNLVSDFTQALVIASIILLLTISFIVVGAQKRMQERQKIISSDDSKTTSINTHIVKRGENIFGNLFLEASNLQESDESANLASPEGKGSSEITNAISSAPDIDTMPSIIDPAKYNPIKYNYIYTGDELPSLPENIDVYKRISPDLTKDLIPDLSKNDLLLNIDKFQDIGINNLTINEDKDYGYSVHLGLKNGKISINKNWEKWPSTRSYNDKPLDINDVLSDQEILDISEEFLNYYNINLDNYGPGEVQKNWMRFYLLSNNKESFRIPETISVVYPLIIEDLNVYEEQGQKYGLTVTVDMKERKVSSLYNLYYHYFESSSYATEKNQENIFEMLNSENIDKTEDKDIEIIDIEIGQARLEIAKFWHYDEISQESYNLYVPSYIFPILSESKPSYFNQENIVIPVIKDFFKENQNPRPLPILLDRAVNDIDTEKEVKN